MALKKTERDGRGDREGSGPEMPTSPSHARSGTADATAVAAASDSHPTSDQSRSQTQDNRHTFAEEEEESSEDGDTQNFLGLGHAQSRVTADNDSVAGGLGKKMEQSGQRKESERHSAAEEDEESSDEELELIGIAHAVRLTHVRGPSPSQTPTVLSGHSSPDLGSEPDGGEGRLALETSEKGLELWNDKVALSNARAKLAEKSRDSRLDIALRGRLTGMVGVLNLYLDPKLQYTWRNASIMVANVQGRGVKRARKLREWILGFAHSEELPLLHYPHSRWNVLDDEDVSQTLQTLLLSHSKGCYITANDVAEIVAGADMQEKFSHSGISRTSISESTARRWLQQLNWRYGKMQNGMYLDGHEREDVVTYRNGFVARWKGYEKRFHTWDDDGIEHPPSKANWHPVKGGRFRLILVTHDESTFYQNDSRKTHWIASNSKATPLPKGDGQSIMVSDFLTAEWGRLCDDGPDGKEFVFNSLKKIYLILTVL
jgi:hypothetical protein